MSRNDVAAELDTLADLVNRLAILSGDPDRFHILRDEIAKRLRRAARQQRDGHAEAPTSRKERREAMRRDLAPAITKRR